MWGCRIIELPGDISVTDAVCDRHSISDALLSSPVDGNFPTDRDFRFVGFGLGAFLLLLSCRSTVGPPGA